MSFRGRMAELALDDVQRDALPCELKSVGVAQLMWREPASYPACVASRRSSTRTAALDHGRPQVGPSMTQNSRLWLSLLANYSTG